jgi:hypothetical protein
LILIPLHEVLSFRVVFILTGEPNVIPNELAIPLNDRRQLPFLFDTNFLQDIDALRVLPGSSHGRLPEGRYRNTAGRELGQKSWFMDTKVDTKEGK